MKNRITNILVECPDLIPSAKIGVVKTLEPQNNIQYDVRYVPTVKIKKKHIVWADILVTVRGCESVTLNIVREARRLGRFIVYYLDDDLLNLPKDSASYAYFLEHELDSNLKEILSLSHVLWGVNRKIRDKYLPLCNGRWVQNRVPMELSEIDDTMDDGPVNILYAGSTDHEKMIREILSPAVRQVCSERGESVHFTFVGANPGLWDCTQVSYHRFFEDYATYRRFVEDGRFTIGLAVVRTDEFYQCKYYNKFVEYSGIGAAGIYTDCELYRQVIVDGENGILCKNTQQGWVKAIERLVDDVYLRKHCIDGAKEMIRNEFQPSDVCEKMILQLPELIDFRAPHIEAIQVRLKSPLVDFYLGKTQHLLKKYSFFAMPIIAYKAAKILCRLIWKAGSNVIRVYKRN